MTSRFLPYATSPARLTAQLVSDLLVAAWITVWVLVGLAVHHAIAAIAAVGTQVKDGANGISDNLGSAGDSADRIPLVGDAVSTPLRAASEAALDLADMIILVTTDAVWCGTPAEVVGQGRLQQAFAVPGMRFDAASSSFRPVGK